MSTREEYKYPNSRAIFRDEILNPSDDNGEFVEKNTRALRVDTMLQVRDITQITGEAKNRSSHNLPYTLTPIQRAAIRNSKDLDEEKIRVSENIREQLQIPHNPIFEERTKLQLLSKSGIRIMRIRHDGEVEGILPRELSQFLCHSNNECYIRIRGNSAEIVALENFNNFVPGETLINNNIAVLPQLMTGVTDHRRVLEALATPLEDIYVNLLMFVKEIEKNK